MPKFDQLVTGFNSGELSPLLYGSPDNPRYKKGLQTCLNYIPTLQGPLQRRPGTQYVNNVKDSTKPPILVPFQFSVVQTYMLELGNLYMRFYSGGAQVVASGTKVYQGNGTNIGIVATANGVSYTSIQVITNLNTTFPAQLSGDANCTQGTNLTNGSPLELVTPWSYTDLPNLRWVQDADTIYFFHPNYPPYKLQRLGSQNWRLQQVYFQDGPYLPLNSYSLTGDNTGVTLIPQGTTSSVNVTTGPTATVSGAVTDPGGSGQIQITTSSAHGYTTGMYIYIASIVGTTEANNYIVTGAQNPTHPSAWQITVVDTTHFLLNGSVFTNAYVSGGTCAPGLFWQSCEDIRNSIGSGTGRDLNRVIALVISGARYWGTISGAIGHVGPYLNNFAFANASSIQMIMGPTSNPVVFPSSGSGIGLWYLGVYSGNGSGAGFVGNGYPACGSFHQNRLIMAGVTGYPQEVDGSFTGLYEQFNTSKPTDLSVADSNALQFQLASHDSNAIKWLASTAQGLLAGTAVSEWAISPSSTSDALSPTNFNANQPAYFGSASIEPVQSGNAVIYIQRAQRKVRELNYFFQVGTFRSTDMTELSEHISLPTITKLISTKDPQPLVWAIRSDGNFISMVYDRNDITLSAGWTRHQLGGQSDAGGTNPVVYSMATIPDSTTTYDQVWMIVKRFINSATVYTIEFLTKLFDDSVLQEDSFQGDCGATFYSPKTITGITSASPAVVTAATHGFSNGNTVKIVGVLGLNKTTTDANGNQTITNLVNEQTFTVAGVTTNTFQLNDFNGNPIDSTSFSAYVSGGSVAKLITTVSGLTWLEGETVGVLADGALHPDCVVSNSGSITLSFPAAKVQIGYRFNSQGQLMRAEGGAADGTSFGKTRRTTRAAFQVHRIGDLSIGTSFTNLLPIEFSRADIQQADNETPLASGMFREGLESAYDFESQVCWQQNSMLPGNIISITAFMEEQDI